MSALRDHLRSPLPCLIVSLPRNDVDLARAAVDAGAHAIKVHAGVYHHATGVTFPPFEEAMPDLELILQAVGWRVPVGIVPGAPLAAGLTTLQDLARRGFAFIDAYAHEFRASALRGHGMEVWLAPEWEAGYTDEEIRSLAQLEGVDALEASVVPHAAYGTPLSARDLASYSRLARLVGEIPLIVPSQRLLTPEDVGPLYGVGMSNLMVGAVVLGMERSALELAVRKFRRSMEDVIVRVAEPTASGSSG